jgi:hypothetical protein
MFAAGLVSLALGGTMSLFGWHVIRQNRRREAARTALLSQLAFPGGVSGEPVTDPPADAVELFRVDGFPRESSVEVEPLFTRPAPLGAVWRRRAVLAAVSVAGAFAIGALYGLATLDSRPAVAPGAAPAVAAVGTTTGSVASPGQAPSRVELVALTYRVTPAAFLVTGQVRSPAGGALLNDAAAVVEVMDEAGRVLMTVRAPLTRRASNGGDEWTFSATASKATNVARYRVEFQNSERVVIPHVDRRREVNHV